MAKYFIEDTTLTTMADKIRALTGTTGTLTPPQMTTEVQSAKEDVDSAMDALETLGITIPEGSDIGDLAGLVGEVESGTDTSDATAVAEDIMLDKTAYGSDGKLTGTFTLDSEIGTQESLIATIKETLATKALPDSGGGSVETCSVTITSTGVPTFGFVATIVSDGEISPYSVISTDKSVDWSTGVTLNCVVGSAIYCGFGLTNCDVTGSAQRTSLNSGNFAVSILGTDPVTINCYPYID